MCLVVLGFLRTKKDSHGKATNTEEQKGKKKKEQKAETVTEGIGETKKNKIEGTPILKLAMVKRL